MQYYLVLSVGFLAQILFASRMIVQWIQSERAGKVIAPTLYWQTSLIASFLLLIYGFLRRDSVIIGGQLLSYFIYIRNLQLKNEWKEISKHFRLAAWIAPFVLFIFILSSNRSWITGDLPFDGYDPIFVAGVAGQLFLNARFVYQWYWSEKAHESFFPNGFWIISLAGSSLIIVYAMVRRDPVLLTAQMLGFVIYLRNIVLRKKT